MSVFEYALAPGGTSPTDLRIQSLVDCFGLGALVCATVAFLVMRLIRIGRIDGIRLGILGSVMGTDRWIGPRISLGRF